MKLITHVDQRTTELPKYWAWGVGNFHTREDGECKHTEQRQLFRMNNIRPFLVNHANVEVPFERFPILALSQGDGNWEREEFNLGPSFPDSYFIREINQVTKIPLSPLVDTKFLELKFKLAEEDLRDMIDATRRIEAASLKRLGLSPNSTLGMPIKIAEIMLYDRYAEPLHYLQLEPSAALQSLKELEFTLHVYN